MVFDTFSFLSSVLDDPAPCGINNMTNFCPKYDAPDIASELKFFITCFYLLHAEEPRQTAETIVENENKHTFLGQGYDIIISSPWIDLLCLQPLNFPIGTQIEAIQTFQIYRSAANQISGE